MSETIWTAVDAYYSDLFSPPDAALEAALQDSEAAGLPPISVSPNQGKLLMLLAQLQQAQRILEVGTLGGYSTIWLARALPDNGRLVTLELSSRHAVVARANVARAGLAERVTVRVGPAAESLAQLAAEGAGPFDLVFIDADKQTTADYYTWARTLTRPGALIIVDNVVRGGAVVDADSTDASVQGIRRFNERVAEDAGVSATAVQTVGSKGYDGLALIRVL